MPSTNSPSWKLLVAFIVLTGCTAPGFGEREAYDFVITEDERNRALAILATDKTFALESKRGPTYLVDLEVLNQKDLPENRILLITHYRTLGDLALVSRVDLTSGRTLSAEAIPHLPVRVSREEFEIARELALKDEAVRALLGARFVEIEAQVSRTTDRRDPLFGHRVLHLLFRTEDGYLEARARVDLTTQQVSIERAAEVER